MNPDLPAPGHGIADSPDPQPQALQQSIADLPLVNSAQSHVLLDGVLQAIHEHLATPAGDARPREETFQDEHYLQDPTFDAPTTIHRSRNTQPGQVVAGAQPRSEATGIETWTMANFSAGGYSLLWDSIDSSSARVGELVAVLEQANTRDSRWQVGVVRWMKADDNDALHLGIQMLSPSAEAVWATPQLNQQQSGSRTRALLLPGITALQQLASLILPTLPFRVGSPATLDTADSRRTITLSRQLENSGSFAQYHFMDGDESAGKD